MLNLLLPPTLPFMTACVTLGRNVMLDEEVVQFLEKLKASNQRTTIEGGYSGFLERLVRESPEYQVYQRSRERQ
jgi:hypothetical protein